MTSQLISHAHRLKFWLLFTFRNRGFGSSVPFVNPESIHIAQMILVVPLILTFHNPTQPRMHQPPQKTLTPTLEANFIRPYLHQFFDDSHSLNGYRKPLKRPFDQYQSHLKEISIGQGSDVFVSMLHPLELREEPQCRHTQNVSKNNINTTLAALTAQRAISGSASPGCRRHSGCLKTSVGW